MAWLQRQGVKCLLFVLLCQLTHGLNCWCSTTTCLMRNLDLHVDYSSAFSCLSNTISELTAEFVKGDVFDLTTVPNLRHFVLDHSQLDSLIVSLTREGSTVSVTTTPLRTVIFHHSRNLVDVRIDNTLLATMRRTSLTTIILEGNRLREVNFSMFVSMPKLTYLLIGRNLLSSVTVPDGQSPMRLKRLDLSFNRLANANLSGISFAKTIDASGNE
ncbi:uncharacterized protein LOC128718591 [Anopheles marshallii]|uniref:uncharacterized protein LOC128718591 n=1 Tax=Anopheles marshallii TaxID=1521116 RepID=UPI00237C2F0E|nr:uncharacterized protein LOC128718591 [Anopheles marshallii]